MSVMLMMSDKQLMMSNKQVGLRDISRNQKTKTGFKTDAFFSYLLEKKSALE